ncbi:dihydrodipicolinate synthase family protein [Brooklawnia cerclae]|uniref:4-hydroxy-2-oxoglutarate aldolase n=1 Tax=Brooklawnia cerclae TaxID=349934 RepID=A0ABX0SG90_9ACTN|nr:dihydrodipicolinate synthase family protein [Brooklawnia cerclae]NIH56348.1 4-hydroxy-2-oxoglutarate aldolase [Brooklawnia cerclae]
MSEKLRGIIIPVATPFDAGRDDAVDVAALEHNFGLWGETGVAGYMVLGTNGEFKALDDDESRTVIGTAAGLKGDKTLIAGAGRESTRTTIEFIRSLEPWMDRIDYISVLTPNYFAKLANGPALIDYYTAVADASPVPILLYVAPGYANGVVVPPNALTELANHPNIDGIKDTSPAMMADYMLAAGARDDFEVLAGSLSNIMTALAFGGIGGVVSASDYLPDECARLTDLYFGESPEAARRYYRILAAVAKSGGGKQGVASLKAAMNLRGYHAGAPRRPIRPVTPEQEAEIRTALESGLERLHNFQA